MSRSPLQSHQVSANDAYLAAWQELAKRIQRGQSFSGHEPNCFFLNTGSRCFADASAAYGLDHDDDGRAVAVADWDDDGDLDLWFTNRTGPRVRLLENRLVHTNRAVQLTFIGDPASGSPRDAVGARVRMLSRDRQAVERQQTSTITAGDGFLSQSSRTVHFGLAAGEVAERIEVRWPGQREFQPVDPPGGTWQADGRYWVYQTDPQAVAKPREVRQLANLTGRPTKQPGSARQPGAAQPLLEGPASPAEPNAGLWLSVPTRLGAWQYAYRGGDLRPVTDSRKPTLLVLWASWCAPCLTELDELAAPSSRFADIPMRIVALNVELAENKRAQEVVRAAEQALGENAKRLDWGTASVELVNRLDQLRREAIYRDDPLPLPMSFLVDRQNRLRALYAGPVQEETVLEDLAHLNDPPDTWRDRAVPFVGRWAEDLFVTNPIAIASVYRQEGQLEDAHEYLDRYLKSEPPPERSDRSRAAIAARRRLADAFVLKGLLYRDQHREDQALAAWKVALELNPAQVDALLAAADVLLKSGKPQAALRLLQHADYVRPADARIKDKLGTARLAMGQWDQAAADFEAALRIDPRWYPAANNLAWFHATSRLAKYQDGERAVQLVEPLVKDSPSPPPRFLDTLAAAYARRGDLPQAVETAHRALALARQSEDARLADAIEQHLASYLAGHPWQDQGPLTSGENPLEPTQQKSSQ